MDHVVSIICTFVSFEGVVYDIQLSIREHVLTNWNEPVQFGLNYVCRLAKNAAAADIGIDLFVLTAFGATCIIYQEIHQ